MASIWVVVSYILLLVSICEAADFTRCSQDVQAALANGTISLSSPFSPLYGGPLDGYSGNNSSRPLTLTEKGCEQWCGNAPQLSSTVGAFEILTTWVLPVITLLSSLPYDSSPHPGFGNFGAFVAWIGTPAATLSTTLWNIRMMDKCQQIGRTGEQIERDTLFILSCINQYEFPRNNANNNLFLRRNIALLRGTLFPYLAEDVIDTAKRQRLTNITQHLALRLKLMGKKGVYPMAFGIFWFFLSLSFSIVITFDTELASNTAAHSLALGLLLSFLPLLVFSAYLDRTPVSSARCAILIEQWLCQVEALYDEKRESSNPELNSDQNLSISVSESRDPDGFSERVGLIREGQGTVHEQFQSDSRHLTTDNAIESATNYAYQNSSHPAHAADPNGNGTQEVQASETLSPPQHPDEDSFKIGRFLGQGRRIRYCAVTDTVLSIAEEEYRMHRLPSEEDANVFNRRLTKRPPMWWVVWSFSFFVVSLGFVTAMAITYRTVPVGIGCRCLSYIIWYVPSILSWALLGFYQEPGPRARALMWIANTFATMVLTAIMFLQVVDGLNNCWCKSVTWGLNPGYMDFQDGKWYQFSHHVREIWAISTGLGLLVPVCAIVWLTWRYKQYKSLWNVDEDKKIRRLPDVNYDWLLD